MHGRASHLCAKVVHVCSAWMLCQGLLLWKHPTFGGCDVKRDLVPKHTDVRLGHASPISKKVPVQGSSTVCWCQGSSHVLGFLLPAVLNSFPLPRLLPITVTLSLFFRAAPAALAVAESTQASLLLGPSLFCLPWGLLHKIWDWDRECGHFSW